MTRLATRFALFGALLMGFTVMAQAQTTYWLGERDGDSLRFETAVPADAAAIIMNMAPKGGSRYRTFTHTLGGKAVRFHSNEIAWETPKLAEGSFTWATDSGMGDDWKSVNTKSPQWPDYMEALKKLGVDVNGWSSAKVVIAEGTGAVAPAFSLNRDGTTGKPSAAQIADWRLTDMTAKDSLTADELTEARDYFLAIANAGRANTNYRKEAKCKTALNLPANLKPLVLNDKLNKAAQIQAEECAKVKEATHDHGDADLADMGKRLKSVGFNEVAYEAAGGGPLQDCPTTWMKSETHYRPWWNLDEQVVTQVGFGAARADNGTWYYVAVLAPEEKADGQNAGDNGGEAVPAE